MPTYRFTTRQAFRFVASLFAVAVLLVTLTIQRGDTAHKAANAPHPTLHTDRWEFYLHAPSIPVTVTGFDGEKGYWTFYDLREIKLGSFDVEPRTKLPSGFRENPAGCFSATICSEHMVLYFLEPLDRKWCKGGAP